jgi:hypothetical protein
MSVISSADSAPSSRRWTALTNDSSAAPYSACTCRIVDSVPTASNSPAAAPSRRYCTCALYATYVYPAASSRCHSHHETCQFGASTIATIDSASSTYAVMTDSSTTERRRRYSS